MPELSLPLQIILSLILGAVIGLEREINEKKVSLHHQKPTAIAGLRTFALISLLGSFTGVLLNTGFMPFALMFGSAILIMVVVFYFLDSSGTKDVGFTTELALMFTFMLGALLTLNIVPIQMILAAAVVLIVLLSQKQQIKEVVEDVQRREINAFIGFAVIALVILPFLPNTSYSLSDLPFLRQLFETFHTDLRGLATIELLNPFKLWIIVALITGIDLVGYILERTIGQKRGWILTSAIGGFISSTATTIGLAQQSKESKNTNHLVSAALIANLTSFFQIGVLVAGVNSLFFVEMLPVLIGIIIAGFVTSVFFLQVRENNTEVNLSEEAHKEEIFNFIPALKFAGLYLAISIATKVALTYFGNSGFLLTSGIGALVGLDAVMINAATLAGGAISASLAIWTFVLVNAVNLIGKSVYSYIQGSREFTVKFTTSVGIIIAASIVIALLF